MRKLTEKRLAECWMTLYDLSLYLEQDSVAYKKVRAAMGEITTMVRAAPVDLRTCKPGDKLRSVHGLILTYIGPLLEDNYMDHAVEYPNGSMGTRTHEGYVYRGKRLPEDHDIVEIIAQEG